MSTPDPNSAALFDELTQDFGPLICDQGHPGGISHKHSPPCHRPASYSVLYHTCQPCLDHYGADAQGPGYGIWCAFHLAKYVTAATQMINEHNKRGITVKCFSPCPHVYRSVTDVIWGIKLLTPKR